GRPFPRAKTRLHDSGMKTALVAHWPNGIAKPGSECSSLVSAIDLAPTVLSAAGVSVPESMQGVSLLPVFENPTTMARRYAFSEHNWHDYEAFGRSVRGNGFLYILNRRPYAAWQGPADSVSSPSHQSLLKKKQADDLTKAQRDIFLSPRPAVELYDVASDPAQLRNLAGQSAYAKTETQLADVMKQWQEATGDTVPEKLTPDTFDRETGKRIVKGTPRGTAPGSATKADRINASGPR
ncbi:MAG: sulfatase/phosphatase domain-containing protein, partial [Planctomycetaceae bacterium]